MRELTKETTVTVERLSGDEWCPERIVLPLEEDFTIKEENVDAELCTTPRLLSYYGDLAADLRAQAERYKDRRDYIGSLKGQEIRNEGGKITEGGIKEQILTHDPYMQTQNRMVESEMDAQKVENFFRSMQRKADCLIALAYKQRAEIAKGSY